MRVTLSNSITICSSLLLIQIDGLGKTARSSFRCSVKPDVYTPRSFMLDHRLHWPKGNVPFVLDPKFSKKQVLMIKDNIHSLENVSCVKWVPRKTEKDYVNIKHTNKSAVCSSEVGRRGGRQFLYLGDNCFLVDHGYQGAILHESLHTLGFVHEQQRVDRDCYVKVYAEAIVTKAVDFAITPGTSITFPYDLHSIMHYGVTKDMEPLNGGNLGSASGKMTKLDVMKLNFLYCGGKTYCQLNATDCLRLKKAEQNCTMKQKSKGIK